MSNAPDFEARLSAVEDRVARLDGDVAVAVSYAAAARHLAAARDRDLADLAIKVEAHRAAINALGVQTASRFDQVDQRFEQVDRRFDRLEDEMRTGFTGMRSQFERTAAGMAQIVDLLTRDDDQ